MHPGWARAIRNECSAAGIAFFFKQVGNWGWKVPKAGAPKAKGLMPDGKVVEFGVKGSQPILRGSKKAAGRYLDCKLHDDMPNSRPSPSIPKMAAYAKSRADTLRSPVQKRR